jgi:serine/threonine-protein kinase
LERIGEGAMGEVFRAVNVHDGSQAALKLVHRDASANPETRRRLEREGELVSALSHPNIVRLLERGEHDGRLYLAMEYLAGKTLQDRLAEPPALTTAEAVAILRDIAAALAALHERGVIHRDLHPGNVMLVPGAPTRLLDFGLARASTSHTVTRANTLMGSLPYLAPEVVAGQPARAASDLFALGVIGCECLSGKRLWRASQTLELLVEIARFVGPDRNTLEALPPGLSDLIQTLLDPDPELRGSARYALDRFAAAIEEERARLAANDA